MSYALRWERHKGELRTYVSRFGYYIIKRHDRNSFRVWLNSEGTQHYGNEDECMRKVQRVVNSMTEQMK